MQNVRADSSAGGERWAQVVVGVRDAFIATGQSAQAGVDIVGRLWDAIKTGGPEAVAAIIAEIQPILDEANAIDALFETTVQGLQGLVDEAIRTGELLPGTLEPYLATLEELGADSGSLAVIRGLMDELAQDAGVDWKAMEAAAKEYGIELATLGPAFDRAKLHDAANQIFHDFTLLKESGVDVGTVLTGMTDEINELVLQALAAGVDLPANMQPIIEHLIEQGLLIDEDGKKLTDMAGLNFAEPMVDKFELVIEKLQELIDRLLGTIGTTEDLGRTIGEIPSEIPIDITFEIEDFELPDFRDISIPIEFDIEDMPSFAHGGIVPGALGMPVLAKVHGGERVQSVSERRSEWISTATMEQRMASIEQLLRDQEFTFSRAVGAAVQQAVMR